MFNTQNSQENARFPSFLALFGILVMGFAGAAQAQSPVSFRAPASTRQMGAVPERGPRSQQQVNAFIQGLGSNDAKFQVIVGQGRLLTLRQDLLRPGGTSPLIATADPTVIDFDVVGPRHLRITGRRIGVTDLSIITGDTEDISLEVHVVADLTLLHARLRQTFPDAQVELTQIREHVVVGGEARSTRQVSQIIQMVKAYVNSLQTSNSTSGKGAPNGSPGRSPNDNRPDSGADDPDSENGDRRPDAEVYPESNKPDIEATIPPAEIINVMRVPGPQQVMLKVQFAELNRTALRRLGVSALFQDSDFAVGTTVGGPLPAPQGGGGGGGAQGLLGLLAPLSSTTTTAFALFDQGKVNFMFNALRRNQVVRVLAEPTLVAMHGEKASFLAGGEFPVPVPQTGGGGGGSSNLITIQFKDFGVGLDFLPFILDEDRVRLTVDSEVSSIDFSTGVVIQGTSVPGISTRRTGTIVELREGQTLAVSGLLQVQLDGQTDRIPGLGDLPHIGSFFRNNTAGAIEKELIVLVTPYLVEGMDPEEVPMLPGAEIEEPDDVELFLRGRIEGREGRMFRATAAWDDPLRVEKRRRLEESYIVGPYGYSQ